MNYAPVSRIITAPSPGSSGTTATVAENTGDRYPAVPFTGLMCPAASVPILGDNAEEVTVTSISGDDVVFTRAAVADRVSVEQDWVLFALRTMPSYDIGQTVTITEDFDSSNPPYAVVLRRPDGTQGSALATDLGSGDASYSFIPYVGGRWQYRFQGASEVGVEQDLYVRFSDVL